MQEVEIGSDRDERHQCLHHRGLPVIGGAQGGLQGGQGHLAQQRESLRRLFAHAGHAMPLAGALARAGAVQRCGEQRGRPVPAHRMTDRSALGRSMLDMTQTCGRGDQQAETEDRAAMGVDATRRPQH